MRKLKKGDNVIVIAGKDKGKTGAVLRVKGNEYLIIQGVNSVKKHEKPNPMKGSQGGIVEREMPIHISNVAIYNYSSKRADRVGVKIDDGKNKYRIFKSNGAQIGS